MNPKNWPAYLDKRQNRREYRQALMAIRPVCVYCDRRIAKCDSTLDHRQPVSQGGGHAPHNLALCCADCNGYKGNMPLEQWLRIVLLMQAANFYAMSRATQRDWIAQARSDTVDAGQPVTWGQFSLPEVPSDFDERVSRAPGRKSGSYRFPGCPKGLSPGARKQLFKRLVIEKQGGECAGCGATKFSVSLAVILCPDGNRANVYCAACNPKRTARNRAAR